MKFYEGEVYLHQFLTVGNILRCAVRFNLALALLVANRYVPDWTTGPNQTLPLANH